MIVIVALALLLNVVELNVASMATPPTEIVPEASAARLALAERVMVMVSGPLVLVVVVDFEVVIAPVPSKTTSRLTASVFGPSC